MAQVVYLLHRFPRSTDTFIRREIRSLVEAGTSVNVISVWKPADADTTSEILQEWSKTTCFLLPRAAPSMVWMVWRTIAASPLRFAKALWLAAKTSTPGIRGLTYQCFYFLEAVLAADVIRNNGARHIHNHFGDQSGIVTMLAACLADIGYSISFHGPHVFIDGKYGRLREKVGGACFIRAISYFCCSQLLFLTESSRDERIKVVHCGIDVGKYVFRPPRKDVRRVFCAARLSHEKGVGFLLDAFESVRQHHREIELRVAGDGPVKAELLAMTTKLNLTESVQFLGFLNEKEMLEELQLADIVVIPSIAEGLPTTAMEAMAAGVPVIATAVGGIGELIDNHISGLLVRPADPDALAKAITHMVQNYEFRMRVAESGRRKVVDEFDIIFESKKLNRLLEEFCCQ